MTRPKIIVVGSVRFSATMLEALVDEGANICGVVTKQSSTYNADFQDLSPICRAFGIDYLHTQNVNSSRTINWISERNPDVGFCVGWSQLFGTELLDIPRHGFIGYHPAALPLNRGRHPIIWALVLGLPQTGSTFFWMDANADSGDIASQRLIAIHESDDATSLYSRIESIGKEQIRELLHQLTAGSIVRIPQTEKGNVWRKRSAKDGHIDWRMASTTIVNLVRALSYPYPGATFSHGQNLLTIWKAQSLLRNVPENLEPGRVLKGGASPVIKCGVGAVRLIDFEPRIEFAEGETL